MFEGVKPGDLGEEVSESTFNLATQYNNKTVPDVELMVLDIYWIIVRKETGYMRYKTEKGEQKFVRMKKEHIRNLYLNRVQALNSVTCLNARAIMEDNRLFKYMSKTTEEVYELGKWCEKMGV